MTPSMKRCCLYSAFEKFWLLPCPDEDVASTYDVIKCPRLNLTSPALDCVLKHERRGVQHAHFLVGGQLSLSTVQIC